MYMWEGNTKANLREIRFGGVDYIQMLGLRYGPVSSFYEHGVEPMGSVKASGPLTGSVPVIFSRQTVFSTGGQAV